MRNRIITAIFCFLLVLSSATFGQKKNTLVQGKVFDDSNGKPLSVTLVFRSESGNIVPIKSNGNDGSFQGVLENGHYYGIGIKGWLIISPQNNIETPKEEKYQELNIVFKVKKIEVGGILMNSAIFEPGSATLSGDYSNVFAEVFGFLEANANVNVAFRLSTEDTYFTAKTEKRQVTDAKGKVKVQKVKVSPQEQMNQLMKDRVASVNQYIIGFKKYFRRIALEEALLPGSKPVVVKSKTKGKNPVPEVLVKKINNLTVKITKILDI